jgi:hypothetical protein
MNARGRFRIARSGGACDPFGQGCRVLQRSNAVLAAAAETIWKSFTKYSTNF